MNQRERDALDAHITGNYGEDQMEHEDTESLGLYDLIAASLRRLIDHIRQHGEVYDGATADADNVQSLLPDELDKLDKNKSDEAFVNWANNATRQWLNDARDTDKGLLPGVLDNVNGYRLTIGLPALTEEDSYEGGDTTHPFGT